MKSLLLGIALIIVLGFGGLVYRNAIEYPLQPIRCPADARVCPDGTAISRTGNSCSFPVCPSPNISLSNIAISFALPEGFTATELPDADSVAAYIAPASASSTNDSIIIIRRYAINASSTALATIRQTALNVPSGLPISITSFSSTMLGRNLFTVVPIQRFEGVVDTAYYLGRETDVLRFDAINTNVTNWTDPKLDVSTLPATSALRRLLTTLQKE